MTNTQDRTPGSTGFRSFFKIFIIILILFVSVLYWYGNQLVVVMIPEGNLPKISFTTYKGDVWNIKFTHSVQLTPVLEFFEVEGANDLIMTHTIYQSLGVGLPYLPSEGKFTKLPDGRFKLDMNRPFDSVKLRTAFQARHMIIHGDTEYDLCKLYGQGTLIEIKVMKRFLSWFL